MVRWTGFAPERAPLPAPFPPLVSHFIAPPSESPLHAKAPSRPMLTSPPPHRSWCTPASQAVSRGTSSASSVRRCSETTSARGRDAPPLWSYRQKSRLPAVQRQTAAPTRALSARAGALSAASIAFIGLSSACRVSAASSSRESLVCARRSRSRGALPAPARAQSLLRAESAATTRGKRRAGCR